MHFQMIALIRISPNRLLTRTEVNVTHLDGRKVISAAALCAALTFAGGTAYADNNGNGLSGDVIDRSVVQQGFDASPIPKDKLNMKGKDPYLVGLGAYLVNGGGDCNGCHTFPRFLRPGGTPRPTSGPPATTNFTGNETGAGSDSRYGNPYLDMLPTGDGFEPKNGQLKANTNTKHFLAGGRCFGFF